MESKIYTDLSNINVNEHIEKKNNLSYLSWTWAIDTLEKYCDEHNLELDYGRLGIDELGLVNTYVSINGKTKKMWLPIMDYRNKQIEKPSSTDINKAFMRCLVKNIALWGLGLYIYAGEDLPNGEEKEEKESPVVVECVSFETWNELNGLFNKDEIRDMFVELGITNGKNMPQEYALKKIKERKQ